MASRSRRSTSTCRAASAAIVQSETSMTLRVAFIALAVAGTVATLTTPADAQRGRSYADGGYVVAESQWGNGTVSGAVRRGGPTGWQVQMPRGTWINCV